MILGEVVSDIFMIFVRSDFVIIFRVYIDVRDICRTLLVMMLLVLSLVSRVMISVISSASGVNVVNIFIVLGSFSIECLSSDVMLLVFVMLSVVPSWLFSGQF